MHFYSMRASFILALNNISFSWYITIYLPFIYRTKEWLFLRYCNYNEVVINMHVKVLCGRKFLTHLGRKQGAYILDNNVSISYLHKKLSNYLQIFLHHFAFQPATCTDFCCSWFSPAVLVITALYSFILISM